MGNGEWGMGMMSERSRNGDDRWDETSERKKKRKKQWSTGEDWEESGVKICRQVNAQKSGGFTQTCGGPTSTDRIPVLLPVMGPIVDPHLEGEKQESNLSHVGEMGSPHMGKNGCHTSSLP